MSDTISPTSAAPGFQFGDLYAVGLLAIGVALLLAVVALDRNEHDWSARERSGR